MATSRPIISNIPGVTTPFLSQLHTPSPECAKKEPAVFMNTFVLPPDADAELFLQHWQQDALVMKAQYGMLAGQLHRGVGIAERDAQSDGKQNVKESNVFVNIAVWESIEAFQKAFENPQFQKQLDGYPTGTTLIPTILNRVAVGGICTT